MFLFQYVTDPPDYHSFVSVDKVNTVDKGLYVYYAGNFNQAQRKYFVVAKFSFTSDDDMATFKQKSESGSSPIVLRSSLQQDKKKKSLHDLLFNDSEETRESEKFDFYVGLPAATSEPFMTADMKIVDVPRYDHFDKADDDYPENATYILYGDTTNAYLFHAPTKFPDYLQVKAFPTKQRFA